MSACMYLSCSIVALYELEMVPSTDSFSLGWIQDELDMATGTFQALRGMLADLNEH